jgi:dCMP deaminase
MKSKIIPAHMRTAENYAEQSSARRLKVGAILVKDNRIISIGYNGMPEGWDNNCETETYSQFDNTIGNKDAVADTYPYIDDQGNRYRLVTKPEVLHAEMNALMKLARSSESGEGASIFVTHAPCIDCAKGIYQAGIKEVYYKHVYRSDAGLEFLKKCGIHAIQVE